MSANPFVADAATSADPQDKYIVPGLERGLRLLAEFSARDRVLSAADLSRRLNVPRSTVFRLLATLSAEKLRAEFGAASIEYFSKDNAAVGATAVSTRAKTTRIHHTHLLRKSTQRRIVRRISRRRARDLAQRGAEEGDLVGRAAVAARPRSA